MKNNKSCSIDIFPVLTIIAIILIVLVFVLLCLKNTRENFENHAPSDNIQENDAPSDIIDQAEDPVEMANAVENFIRYPGLQMFCTVMKGNLATFWAKLPESKAEGHYVKLCCSSCHGVISKSLCEGGDYEVSTLNEDDISNLVNYYNENGLDFGLDEDTIREQYGNTVLKLRHNDVSYPVQVLKLKEHIEEEIDETLTHSCN